MELIIFTVDCVLVFSQGLMQVLSKAHKVSNSNIVPLFLKNHDQHANQEKWYETPIQGKGDKKKKRKTLRILINISIL